MKNIIKIAKNILELGKLEQIDEMSYKVDGEDVIKLKREGVTRLSCSCRSCTMSKNKDNICSRKAAVIIYEAQDFRLKKIIREELITAEEHREAGLQINPYIMTNLLNDLRSFI